MSLQSQQSDHAICLSAAEELLGGPARAFDLAWGVYHALYERLRLEESRGIGTTEPITEFNTGRRGHSLELGIARYRIDAEDGPIRVAQVCAPYADRTCALLYRFWAVRTEDYRRLYRLVREITRKRDDAPEPLMHEADRRRLWDNTVGFLQHGCERLRRYGVPQKRGVLLLGTPGNGKTMACRWLRSACAKHGLGWKSVVASDLEQDDMSHVFRLDEPGIIFFDDVDMALRDRAGAGTNALQSAFLGGLDGMEVQHGTVFLFTSNALWHELDPAFRRPGRIDIALNFPPPDAELRLRFLRKMWQPEIVAEIREGQFLTDTAGLSFAEIDEIKKLLVLRHFDSGHWEWEAARTMFAEHRKENTAKSVIGFAASPNMPAQPSLSACSSISP